MKKLLFAIVCAALVSVPAAVTGQSSERSVAGAASGSLPAATMLGAITVSSVDLGTGVLISADGSASGWFHAVLRGSVSGQSRGLTIEANVTQGAVAQDGSVTFTGSGTIDLGDGTPAVPLGYLSVATSGGGLVLSIDAATLPVELTSGTVAIE
jgi:hypothetical protein